MSSPASSAERSADRIVAQKAYWQHGLVTTAQLRALGVTRAEIRTRVRRGQWAVAAPGVLRMTGSEIQWESVVLAQVLSLGNGALASHRCAAALWQLDGFRATWRVEVVVPRSKYAERPPAIVHRSTDLDLIKPVKRRGIPTTPIGRTVLDLGAVCGRSDVLLAVDDARRRNLVDWDGLLTVLARHARSGRAGVGTLRSILDEHYGEVAQTDSAFERLVMTLLAVNGLPEPTLQHKVQVADRTYRIDLAYPHLRIAIELDGQHHREREVWEQDHLRQTDLTNAGWHVLRFTWLQYTKNPAHLLREIRAALRRRERTSHGRPVS